MVTGKDTFTAVNGPMARSVDDLALWMKVALNEQYQVDKDPYTKLIPFDEKQQQIEGAFKLREVYFKFFGGHALQK